MAALSIRKTVPLMILVPLLSYVALTGWFAVSNGRRTVDELSSLNSRTINARIIERLKDYLETPVLLNQMNANAIRLGEINIQNPDLLRRQFLAELRLLSKVDGIEFGFAQTGEVQSVFRWHDGSLVLGEANASTRFSKIYYSTDLSGRKGKILTSTQNYDARKRPWYREAISANKSTWTKPFQKFSDKKLIQISLVQPVYAQDSGKLLGVFSVQFLQANISQFLGTLEVGKSGKTFIINRRGELIAASCAERLFKENQDGSIQLIPALEAQDSLIRESAKAFQLKYTDFNQIPSENPIQFKAKGALQLAQIVDYKNNLGLDWRVITVVPQSDFTSNIDKTKQQSFLLGLSALVVSVGLGLLATRWLVKPILSLCNAAEQVGKHAFDPTSLTPLASRSDELGQLGKVFQDMFQVVHDREQSLNTRVQELTHETDKLKKIEAANRMSGAASLQDLLQRSQHLRLQVFQCTLKLPELLKTISFFSQADDTELEALMALGRERRLVAREVICHENEREDFFFFVLVGRVEVYLEKFNLSLSTLGAGSFFGEISLMLKTPRSASVKTIEPSILFVVDSAGFQTLYQKYPKLAFQINQKVQERQMALEQSKTELQKMEFADDVLTMNPNFLLWSRQRLKSLFGM